MTRSEQLKKEAEELAKLESKLFTLLGECSRPTDSKKTDLWNAIVPHIRSAVEKKMKEGYWDKNELMDVVLMKAAKVALGDTIWEDLEKV